MIKAALEYLISLKRPETITVNNLPMVTGEYKLCYPPSPSPLKLHTLGGLVDYLLKDIELGKDNRAFIQVDGHRSVSLRSTLHSSFMCRDLIANVGIDQQVYPFGQFVPVSDFVVKLQALFVQDETTGAILRVVGNIAAVSELKTLDDGISQTVKAKVGIATVDQVILPNPVFLRPYRTFREVEQPSSPFILRMRADTQKEPVVALFEADGGAWELEAIENIANFLNDSGITQKILA